jgi:AbrB family looped-hinge helix DNA binding protein
MIIDLRKKSQITIPKVIVDELNIQEGDHLEVFVRDGAIIIEPVAVYSKFYIKKLEDTVMRLNEEPTEYNVGPFKSVEDAINYLEEIDEENDNKENEKKK